jgi:hypothetical protein
MFTKNTGSSDIDFYVCAPHIYRSDLGGMVDNPDRGDSYVPTTSSALYLPRIGHHVYNGSAWVNEGYLHESEARTNLVLSSGDLSGFSGVRSSLTSDQAVSPTGNVDATAFIEDSTAANTHVGNLLVANPAAAGTYTFSVYAKQNGRQYFYVHLNVDPASTNITYGAVFDLDAGTVAASGSQGTPTSTDHSIQDVGNGWYRCSVTLGNPSGLRLDVRISLQDSSTFVVGGAAYNGDGVSGVYVYGAQIEAASTPSSYIPTSGSTVTRSADTMTASNLPWPAPNVIGPELVTNGTFDTDVSGWSIDGTNTGDDVSFSFSSGQMLVSRGADSVGGRPYQQIAVEIGKTYHLTFDSSYLTGGASVFYVGSTLAGNQYVSAIISSSTAEKRSFTFTAATSTMYITTWPAVNSSFTVDNISVREINPLAVSIKMDGRMTYADEGASIQSVFTRWTIDANNRIETRLDTNSTLTGQVTFLQTASGTTDLVNSSTTAYSPGILVPYTIASRHGSTFLNGAIDGTALTADTTPTALPDLSATDLNLGYDYMGTIKEFAIWNVDLTDAGLEEATE